MGETRKRMSPLRRFIANKLRLSVTEIPQISSFYQVDVTELMAYKKELAEQGKKVTVTAFFVRAIVQAMSENMHLNCRIEGDECISYDEINPGIAMQSKQGLFVLPILNAADKGALQISEEMKALSEKLDRGEITQDDMKGGTLTISSPGQGRTDMFQSIINNNECLIIGIGRISKQAVVMPDDTIAVRQMTWICNNINHALVDGKAVKPFTNRVCELLENPREMIKID